MVYGYGESGDGKYECKRHIPKNIDYELIASSRDVIAPVGQA